MNSRGSSTGPLSEWGGKAASNTGHKHVETKTDVSGEEVMKHEDVKRVCGDQS